MTLRAAALSPYFFRASLGVAVALWIFASYRRPPFPLGGRDPGTSPAADTGLLFFAIHLSHRGWLEPHDCLTSPKFGDLAIDPFLLHFEARYRGDLQTSDDPESSS